MKGLQVDFLHNNHLVGIIGIHPVVGTVDMHPQPNQEVVVEA